LAEQDPARATLAAVANGDRKAFASLYNDYSAALFGVISRIVGDKEKAEEVLQDAFVRIWKSASSYDPERGRAFTWMLNIARNAAIDVVRTKSHQMQEKIRTLDKHVYRLDSGDAPTGDHIGMDRILAGLSEDNRLMIDMAYYQGYSQQEIADKTGIPLGTVKSRTRTALNQLRDALQHEP
jgi:RNA polymerase sigma-70 factor (ECF subfamily)